MLIIVSQILASFLREKGDTCCFSSRKILKVVFFGERKMLKVSSVSMAQSYFSLFSSKEHTKNSV